MGAPVNILVLDETEDVRGYLSSAFPKIDFKVLKLSTAEETVAHATKDSPAIVFINGDDPFFSSTVAQLKSDGATKDVPVVLLTSGESTDLLVDQWFAACPPDFTAKRPITGGFLSDHIKALFDSDAEASSGAKKKKKSDSAPSPSAAPAEDSQLVKALTEQIATLDDELQTLRKNAKSSESSEDAAAAVDEAVAEAKAAADIEIANRDKRIAELQEAIEKRATEGTELKTRIEEMEASRAAQAETAQAEADSVAETAKAAAEAATTATPPETQHTGRNRR